VPTKQPANAHASRHPRRSPGERDRRTAVCAGAQRPAAAAALKAQATLPGSSTSCSPGAAGEAHVSFPVPPPARRYAQPMFFPEAQPTSDPSSTQQRLCTFWLRVPGGTLSQQCFQPISRCTTRSRRSSSHLVAATSLLATRGRCIAMICLMQMTLSDAGSFCSILFPLPATQRHRDEPISEQARIALPACVAPCVAH
jgi:hypothetical protein